MAVKKRYRELPEEEEDLNEKPPAKQKHPKEVASLQVSDLHAAKWDLNVTLQSSTTHTMKKPTVAHDIVIIAIWERMIA